MFFKAAATVTIFAAACFGCAAAVEGAEPVTSLADFQDFTAGKGAAPDGWETWSPRTEIAPQFSIDTAVGRKSAGGTANGGSLKITGTSPAAFGCWRRQVDGIAAGRDYRFLAHYRTQNVAHERRSVAARLEWLDADGQRVRPPDYMLDTKKQGEWTTVEHTLTAPEKARSVRIELSLGWCAGGAVWWDDISLNEASSPRRRVVRAMTVYERPQNTKSAEESVARFCRAIEASAAAEKPDIICLPEGITVVGNGKSYAEVSESIPGPTTRTLGALAKKHRAYIVGGIYERVGGTVYNTAVLIGRDGEVKGTYRKTHLPREEVEAGLTPGDAYPVFDTDFGKVGVLICWDVQFPEPARAMALQGAEVLLLPIWGGSDVLARARAIENHVFLISSSYDMKTFIVDPAGSVLAEATKEQPVVVTDLHLDRKIVQPWLGDMKPRTWKERRPDIPVP